MNNESLTPTLIIFIVVIAMVGGFIYMKSAGSSTLPVTVSSATNTAPGQFKRTTSQLSSINLNSSLFSNPEFTALKDITTPINQEPVGRPNPFAPFR